MTMRFQILSQCVWIIYVLIQVLTDTVETNQYTLISFQHQRKDWLSYSFLTEGKEYLAWQWEIATMTQNLLLQIETLCKLRSTFWPKRRNIKSLISKLSTREKKTHSLQKVVLFFLCKFPMTFASNLACSWTSVFGF